jgi:hypothetical protein
MRHIPESASFCKLYDRKSFILCNIQQKQLQSVSGKTETASFSQTYNKNSFIL